MGLYPDFITFALSARVYFDPLPPLSIPGRTSGQERSRTCQHIRDSNQNSLYRIDFLELSKKVDIEFSISWTLGGEEKESLRFGLFSKDSH